MKQIRFADRLDVVYKRSEEWLQNHQQKMGTEMSFAEMWDTGGQTCFGRVESRTIMVMPLDIHLKVLKRQLNSITGV